MPVIVFHRGVDVQVEHKYPVDNHLYPVSTHEFAVSTMKTILYHNNRVHDTKLNKMLCCLCDLDVKRFIVK